MKAKADNTSTSDIIRTALRAFLDVASGIERAPTGHCDPGTPTGTSARRPSGTAGYMTVFESAFSAHLMASTMLRRRVGGNSVTLSLTSSPRCSSIRVDRSMSARRRAGGPHVRVPRWSCLRVLLVRRRVGVLPRRGGT